MRNMIVGEKLTRCPDCGNTWLIRDHNAGELVCVRCGLVVTSSLFDYGKEWRAFNSQQYAKRTRVGAPLTLTIHDTGLSTFIDPKRRGFSGRGLNLDQRAQAYRLAKWQRRSKASGSSDRSLMLALTEMTKATYKLHLPRNVLETASYLYRFAVKKNLIRGRSIRSTVAASLYLACRQCNVIRSLDEIASVNQISKKDVGRAYRLLVSRLEAHVPRVVPQRIVSMLVSQLSLRGETESIALRTLEVAAELKLMSGRGPPSMAAAATYIACLLTGERRTQEQIAQVGSISSVTLRNRFKELSRMIQISLNV